MIQEKTNKNIIIGRIARPLLFFLIGFGLSKGTIEKHLFSENEKIAFRHFETISVYYLTKGRIFSVLETISKNSRELKQVLSKELPQDAPRAVEILSTIKKSVGADIVYLMDLNGKVVACSPYGEDLSKTLTGNNYSFRPYFKQTLEGKNIIYPGVGVTTKKRGLYFSYPVGSLRRKGVAKAGGGSDQRAGYNFMSKL